MTHDFSGWLTFKRGNEASQEMIYSAAAIFVLVPRWYEKRGIDPMGTLETHGFKSMEVDE